MAGSPIKRARNGKGNDTPKVEQAKLQKQLDQANNRIKLQADEIAALKAELARVNPDVIAKSLERAPFPPTQAECDRILALGEIGLTPTQMQAELMYDQDQWREATNKYPQFAKALGLASTRARGKWTQKIHDSLNSNDWKFPYDRAMRFIEDSFDTGIEDEGDASELVHVAIGKEARKLFAREVAQ